MQHQAASTTPATPVATTDTLFHKTIPELAQAGVRAAHWRDAQQMARQRVLSRLLQALFREALLCPDQLIADTGADVTLLPIQQRRVQLCFTGPRSGALGSWALAGDIFALTHNEPPQPVERASVLLHYLGPLLDTQNAGAERLAAITRLSVELDNSQDNDTLCQAYRLAWGARLAAERVAAGARDAIDLLTANGSPRALARTEQWGTGGHPWHPAYKTRLGLTPRQVIALSPEFEAQVRVGLAAVAAHRVSVTTMDGTQPYVTWFAATFPDAMAEFRRALVLRHLVPEAWLPLPVHPWQRDATLRETFARELAAGELIFLPEIAIATHPTMSFRTVAAVNAPGSPMLKLPISMRLTSVERTVSPKSAVMGPRVSALLERILATDAALARVLSIVPERHGLHLIDADDNRARHLSMIVRDNPTTRIAVNERLLPVGALFTPDFTADMTGVAAPLLLDTVLARQADGHRAERAARFFDAYLRVAMPAVVGLYLRYGIALEAHQQNTFVVIDAAGMPQRLVVRDFGDIKIALPALQAQGFSISPFRDGHTTYPDRTIPRKKLIHAFLLCHVGELALALFPEDGSAQGMRQWYDAMHEVFAQHRATVDTNTWAQEYRALLQAPWTFKTFVRMRLRDQSDDMHATLPNPLAAFAAPMPA
ncbi:IucA/IucC family protein [Pandoraea bronchicola]|uniref:Aerobactin synthase n=1 Tax=Pandoraea bronchicola TaxID=2508287 RepID=A0A5E5BP67_9BURK|nr:IucA/IucC family protein [Pandoraea bronchicola]VVE87087.1 Aerobactin synthase [Pandoraea bronchicola]